MIQALLLLLVCQLAGEVTSRALHLPLPGPVLGMLILLLLMIAVRRVTEMMRPVASFILSNMSLLFVPAGVGVVAYLGPLRDNALPLAAALVGSTVASIAVGAWVFTWVARATGNRGAK